MSYTDANLKCVLAQRIPAPKIPIFEKMPRALKKLAARFTEGHPLLKKYPPGVSSRVFSEKHAVKFVYVLLRPTFPLFFCSFVHECMCVLMALMAECL